MDKKDKDYFMEAAYRLTDAFFFYDLKPTVTLTFKTRRELYDFEYQLVRGELGKLMLMDDKVGQLHFQHEFELMGVKYELKTSEKEVSWRDW